MDNQNIYSQELNGFITINRVIISKLGLNSKPFLRTVYMLLIERANYKTGIVYFSSRFAQETLEIGPNKHKKLINELKELGLVRELEHKKGCSTQLEIIHYFEVIDGDRKELNKKIEHKVEITTIEEMKPIFNIIKDKSKVNLDENESEELLENFIKVRGFSSKIDAINYIKSGMLRTNETFNDYCKRIIDTHKNTDDETILNLIK